MYQCATAGETEATSKSSNKCDHAHSVQNVHGEGNDTICYRCALLVGLGRTECPRLVADKMSIIQSLAWLPGHRVVVLFAEAGKMKRFSRSLSASANRLKDVFRRTVSEKMLLSLAFVFACVPRHGYEQHPFCTSLSDYNCEL